MHRRTVLEGLAALPLATTAVTAAEDPGAVDRAEKVDVDEDMGAGVATYPTQPAALWDVELVAGGKPTELQVSGEWLDDQGSAVILRVTGAPVRVGVSFSPKQARQFARDVLDAAAFAEWGRSA